MSATSRAVALFTARASVAACTCDTCPKAPNSTFVNERFIALHMITDRMKPDDPSSAPAVISSLLSSTNPIATAERPAYELRSEITVGMSAPPIGRISSTPNTSDSTTTTGNSCQASGFTTRYRPAPIAIASSTKLKMFWFL